MSVINIQNLTFAYPGSYDNVFENVSLNLDTDWKLGLTGRNGRGKTTLLKLLAGRLEFSGKISSSVNFEYFPYAVEDMSLTAAEILEEIIGDRELWELERELNMLEVEYETLYRPFETLSPGERTKLLISAMFLKENSFLLIDEPTNHLDLKGRRLLSKYLDKKKGFILVSHDRALLDGCIDHILNINKQSLELKNTGYSRWLEEKETKERGEAEKRERLKKEIKRLENSALQTAGWSDKAEEAKFGGRENKSGLRPDRGFLGAKAAKLMKQSKIVDERKNRAIEEKSALLTEVEELDKLKIDTKPFKKKRLVEFKDFYIDYGGGPLFKSLDFTVEEGDRIALSGINGSGKSSILKIIAGQNIPYAGTAEIGSGLMVSYVPQDTSKVKGGLKEYAADGAVDETLFLTILRKMGVPRVQLEKDLSDLSEGQKKKAALAKSLACPANLYVWDEPLNYLDIYTRLQIEEVVLEFSPTVIFVEHDKAFCDRVKTKEISL